MSAVIAIIIVIKLHVTIHEGRGGRGGRGRRKSEGDKNKHGQEKRTEINIGCARDYIALSQNMYSL